MVNLSHAQTDFSYVVTDNECIITGLLDVNTSEVVIPEDIEGASVTEIRSGAFQGSQLDSVYIPDSVIKIGENAFRNCSKLSNVRLPPRCDLGWYSFLGTGALKSIEIPGGVEDIGVYTFGFSGLETITLSEGVKNIYGQAFEGCVALEKIVLPRSVEFIGNKAFNDCRELENIVFKGDKPEIQDGAFMGVNSRALIQISDNVTGFDGSIDGIPIQSASNPLSFVIQGGCDYLVGSTEAIVVGFVSDLDTTLTILEDIEGASVTEIRSGAFQGSQLESVYIPDSVIKIGENAFRNCSKLSNVRLPPRCDLGWYSFLGTGALKSIEIPGGVEDIGVYTFGFSGLETITLSEGVKNIYGQAFEGCVALEKIVLPRSVEFIGNKAFNDCRELENIVFKGDKPEIQDGAFMGVNSRALIEISDNVTGFDESIDGIPVSVVDLTAPVITLNGEVTLEHEAGTTYSYSGATAADNVDDTVTVTTSGTVDESVPGSYTLTYTASDAAGNSATAVTRTVVVADTIAPVITLLGDAAMTIGIGSSFTDPGADVNDSFEGQLSAEITGAVDEDALGSYTLTYDATDSAGNAATPLTRTVHVVDLTPPVITLNGEATMRHAMGTAYEDAGATAIDNVDGTVTVSTTGIVDVNTSGTYTLTYIAIDAAGNTSSTTREVFVGLVTSLNPESVTGAPDTEMVVPFKVNGFNAISGLQFTLEWDPQVMTLVLGEQSLPKVTQSATIPMNGLDFPLIISNNFSVIQPGKVTFLWDEALQPDIGRTLEEGSTLFALHFKLVGDPGSTTQLVIGNDPTPFKVVPASGGDIQEATLAGTVSILDTIVVSGFVTLFGDGQTPVPGTRVQVDVDNESHEIETGEDGYYQMTLTPGDNYVLSASLKTDVKANHGVDVSDIIYLRKHILNREKLNNTMAWLAADTNLDNSIDVADIVAIRKVILSRTSFYSTDANGEAKDMFRFTRLNFKDVDPLLSFTELPEALTMNYQSVSGNLNEVDFAAVKLGDANGDWTPPAGGGSTLNAMAVGIPQTQGDASIGFGSSWSDEDGVVHVALNASASQALMGLELELSWDKDMLKLEGMSSDALSHFIPGVHSHEGSDRVKVAWDDATLTGTTLDANEPVMTYRFRRVGEGSTGLFLEQALLAGEDGILGRMQSASLFLGSGNRSRAGLNGAIKSIEHRDNQIELWLDTRGATSWQLESSPTLEASQWQPLEVLDGAQAWQQLVIPHTSETHFLRLVPVTGPEL